MVKRRNHFARGFTLLEVLVAVSLFMLVMLLLFRGVTAVTATVTLGQRNSQLHRILKATRRVMQQDLTAMLQHPNWPVWVGDEAAAAPQLMLAFLRYQEGAAGEVETEWVQYWREPHPDESRLEQWVRYSGPSLDRDSHKGQWWQAIDRTRLSREVLVDDLIEVNLNIRTPEGEVTGLLTRAVEAVDVRIYLSTAPLPPVATPDPSRLQRMEQEDGSWIHFRCRPDFSPLPEVEVLP